MPAYFLKTILGTAFIAAALTSFLSMMTLMGKPEKKTDPAKLRKIHRAAGIVISILLVPLIYLGRDSWPGRGTPCPSGPDFTSSWPSPSSFS